MRKLDWKFWVLIIIWLGFIHVTFGHAANVELTAETFMVMGHQQGDDFQVDSHSGFKATVKHVSQPIYLWGSFDAIDINIAGLLGPNIKLPGVGIGIRHEFIKGLSIHAEYGYFMPTHDFPYCEMSNDSNWFRYEGIVRYLHNRYSMMELSADDTPWRTHGFDAVEYVIDNDFGGEIGLDYNHQLSERISVGVSGAYRMLKFKEIMNGFKDEWAPGWWQHVSNRDLSGIKLGVMINVTF